MVKFYQFEKTYYAETGMRQVLELNEIFDLRYSKKRTSLGSFTFSLSDQYKDKVSINTVVEIEPEVFGIIISIERDLKTHLIRISGHPLESLLSRFVGAINGYSWSSGTYSYSLIKGVKHTNTDGSKSVDMNDDFIHNDLVTHLSNLFNPPPITYFFDYDMPYEVEFELYGYEGPYNYSGKMALDIVYDFIKLVPSGTAWFYVSLEDTDRQGFDGLKRLCIHFRRGRKDSDFEVDTLVNMEECDSAVVVQSLENVCHNALVTQTSPFGTSEGDPSENFIGFVASHSDATQDYFRVENINKWETLKKEPEVFTSGGSKKDPTIQDLYIPCVAQANDLIDLNPYTYEVVMHSDHKYTLGEQERFLIDKEVILLQCEEYEIVGTGDFNNYIYTFKPAVLPEEDPIDPE